MLWAHCVFLIQPTYVSGARKNPWAGRVHDEGRLRPRSANTALPCLYTALLWKSIACRVNGCSVRGNAWAMSACWHYESNAILYKEHVWILSRARVSNALFSPCIQRAVSFNTVKLTSVWRERERAESMGLRKLRKNVWGLGGKRLTTQNILIVSRAWKKKFEPLFITKCKRSENLNTISFLWAQTRGVRGKRIKSVVNRNKTPPMKEIADTKLPGYEVLSRYELLFGRIYAEQQQEPNSIYSNKKIFDVAAVIVAYNFNDGLKGRVSCEIKFFCIFFYCFKNLFTISRMYPQRYFSRQKTLNAFFSKRYFFRAGECSSKTNEPVDLKFCIDIL